MSRAPRRYLTPVVPALTGAMHQQPAPEHLHCSAWAFTPDYAEAVDLRGAIDAPNTIPSYRAGWRS